MKLNAYVTNNAGSFSDRLYEEHILKDNKTGLVHNQFVNINFKENDLTLNFNIINSFHNKALEFMFNLFINQRKMYRYYKAETEYDEGILPENQFDKIEESCIITLKNENTSNIKDKLVFLYDIMEQNAPEELDYLDYEDLSDLLSVSKYNLKQLEMQVYNECHKTNIIN
jgi:hypothetical protein